MFRFVLALVLVVFASVGAKACDTFGVVQQAVQYVQPAYVQQFAQPVYQQQFAQPVQVFQQAQHVQRVNQYAQFQQVQQFKQAKQFSRAMSVPKFGLQQARPQRIEATTRTFRGPFGGSRTVQRQVIR